MSSRTSIVQQFSAVLANLYLSVHSGETGRDVSVDFGTAERLRFKQAIMPVYSDFLRSCFSKLSLLTISTLN